MTTLEPGAGRWYITACGAHVTCEDGDGWKQSSLDGRRYASREAAEAARQAHPRRSEPLEADPYEPNA